MSDDPDNLGEFLADMVMGPWYMLGAAVVLALGGGAVALVALLVQTLKAIGGGQ